jgi:tetratricopeptide (TPR) repeat protein
LRTGQAAEGLRWIDTAVKRSLGAPARTHANALLWRARLAGGRSGGRRDDDLRAALELFRFCDNDGGIARCLCELADDEAWHGRCETASALGDEAMRFAKRADDEQAIATVLKVQALAAVEYEDMLPRARTALKHLRRLGMLGDAGRLCDTTGYIALSNDRYRDALAWLSDGLEIAGTVGSAQHVFYLRSNEGLAWLLLDEFDEAAVAFAAALAVCRDAAAEDVVFETLLGLAVIAARCGRHQRAGRLVGAATRHATASLGVAEAEMKARLMDEILPDARESYGTERWDRATAQGASLTVQEAIDLGLADP